VKDVSSFVCAFLSCKKNRSMTTCKKTGLFVLVMALVAIVMPMTVKAAPATGVIMKYPFLRLNASTPYWCSGAPASTGTLDGNNCTAYFTGGILTLWNYSGDSIQPQGGDLTIKLIGNNTIIPTCGCLGGDKECGVWAYLVDLIITSEDAGSLAITVENLSGDAYGLMA